MTKRTIIESEEEEQPEQPYNISTLKPDGEDLQPTKTVNQDEFLTSYAQTKTAFSELGYSLAAYEFEVLGPNGRKLGVDQGTLNFFKKIWIEEEPITQTITQCIRFKAWDYVRNDKGKQQRQIKEFLTYSATLEGTDRWGNTIKAHLPLQGLAYQPDVRVRIITDPQTGRQHGEYYYDRLRDKFYIPWEGKKTLDNLLKKTNTNKDNITYKCKVGSGPNSRGISFRCDQYTYEQFANSSFEELEQLARREGGPNGKIHWVDEKPAKVWID